MDRSIDFDSIGSCSLDADSTDFSDTSESCNFISPSATREDFTAGIAERVRRIQTSQPLTPKLILNQPLNQRTLSNSTTTNTTTTTAYFDINSGKISTIVSAPRANDTNGCYFNGNAENFLSTKTFDLQSPTVVAHANKKPSYLNLACCVNGYSNYTTYDSVERKEINKSREASPIRPIITMSRQPRSNDNLLSVPAPVTFIKQSPLTSITKRFASLNIGSAGDNSENNKDTTDNAGMNGSVSNRKSFIQQRVEKLYGTTKILTNTTVKNSETIQTNGNGHHNNHVNGNHHVVDEKENDGELYMNSLPVMKHLRPEFCRQLQFLSSPKKMPRVNGNQIQTTVETSPQINSPPRSVVVDEIIKSSEIENIQINKANDQNLEPETKESVVMEHIISKEGVASVVEEARIHLNNNNNNNCVNNKMEIETIKSPETEVRDGHYFLRLLEKEKIRILKIADETDRELQHLQSDPATVPTEDVIGLILSAVGKSRLLATKKFKQFEGLCHENLKPTADGPQTLCGDLQGFWDMMMLQVDNIDAAFDDLRQCRENGWQKPQPPSPQAPKGSRLTKRPLTQSQAAKGKTTTSAGVKKPSTAPSNSEAAQKREEQRKKLMELKRLHKAAMQNGNGNDNEAILS